LYFLDRLINFNKICPLEVYREENWKIKLNVIEQIAEKSPPIFRWLQSVFRHSDHFVPANSKEKVIFTCDFYYCKYGYYMVCKIALREIQSCRQVFKSDAPFEWSCQPLWVAMPTRLKGLHIFFIGLRYK
jgi:hypothetical protein